MIGNTVSDLVDHAIAVPRDLVTGNFGKIPGDIFNNAKDIGIGTLTGGTGNFFADTALNAAGSALGSSIFGGGNKGPSAPPKEPAFHAAQQDAMATPPSLSQFASLSPEQQTSNIATQGVYGGGEGGDESKYFLNLINRRLVDPQGKVGDAGQVSGVENSFLSQLGLGGYNDSNDLLKKISKYGMT